MSAHLHEELADNSHPRERSLLRTYTEYAAARALLAIIGVWPRSIAMRAGYATGRLARALFPRLRRNAKVNLRLAFPELDESARQRILNGTFRNLGRLLGEISQFPRLNRENISSIVRYDGLEHFEDAYKSGRGVILLTGHIGAWELSVFAHSVYGYPMAFLARRVDNPLVEGLAERYRLRYGNRSIDKRGSIRHVLKTLKDGGVVGILADLNTTRDEGVFCDFFGTSACTTAGVATLALRTGAVVVPGYMIWDEAARIHKLRFEPPIPTIESGNQREDVIANTSRYTKVLEAAIRRHPDQWLWIHRRWRTRPPGDPEIY